MTPTWLALWNRRKSCSHVALHNSAGQPRDYRVEAHAPRRRSQPCTCLLRGQAPEVPRRDRLVVLYACCLVSADSLSFSAAKQIVENIQAGAWTAAAVLEAFIARAGQAQEATNCLTEGAWPNHIICCFGTHVSNVTQCSLRRLERKRASWMPSSPRQENSRDCSTVCQLPSRT